MIKNYNIHLLTTLIINWFKSLLRLVIKKFQKYIRNTAGLIKT